MLKLTPHGKHQDSYVSRAATPWPVTVLCWYCHTMSGSVIAQQS